MAAAIAAFDLISTSDALRERLTQNTRHFRAAITHLGFDLIESVHPIVPVLFSKFDNDAQLAGSMSKALYDEGIYVIGFSYPVVLKGQARIRVQISAAHTGEHIDACVAAFARVGRAHGIIH